MYLELWKVMQPDVWESMKGACPGSRHINTDWAGFVFQIWQSYGVWKNLSREGDNQSFRELSVAKVSNQTWKAGLIGCSSGNHMIKMGCGIVFYCPSCIQEGLQE